MPPRTALARVRDGAGPDAAYVLTESTAGAEHRGRADRPAARSR
ncbi:hypothetical protein OG389_16950 [Streptomyces sp. NBC_00435]